jgi:hypothetical protein
MKKTYKDEKIKVVKELGVKDKVGTWIQIEFLSGINKGCRIPTTIEECS